MELSKFIEQMPKVELHLHLEGTMEAELMLNLAMRNNIALPYKNIEEIKSAYKFSNLQDFLDLYYAGCDVLREEQDFYELTAAYFQKAAQQNIQHAEIMFDPQSHTSRGTNLAHVFNGIARARNEAKEKYNISSILILSFLRHLSEEDAFTVLDQALAYREHFDVVGLDSSELGNPPEKFEKVFNYSGKIGLKKVAHAGEEGPADYIWKSLSLLKVDRIDHGNNSMSDAELLNHLSKTKMGLTLCPLSNLKLCVIDKMQNHPLKKMLSLGIKATVNSDDPAYFGGYLTENYLSVIEALNMNKSELLQTALNAIEVCFAGDQRKLELQKQLEQYFQKH